MTHKLLYGTVLLLSMLMSVVGVMVLFHATTVLSVLFVLIYIIWLIAMMLLIYILTRRT